MKENKNVYEVSYRIEFIGEMDEVCVHEIRERGTDLNSLSSSKYLYQQLKYILTNSYFVESEPIQIRKEVTLNGEYYDSDEWDIHVKKNPFEMKILDLE